LIKGEKIMRMNHWLKIFIVLGAILFSSACIFFPKPYDLIIKDGFVLDGSGNPWFKADIGIKGEKIAAIGTLAEGRAKKVIDARSLIVCPGFIDIHTHCDREIVDVPTVDNYISQGVTTVIGGNCGGHPYPLKELFQKIERRGISTNFGVLVGHNTIRQEVMAYKMADPTKEEMEKMKKLIAAEMEAGALGFSTGLSYLPGTYSKTEELVELASVAAQYGGIYATHLRNQGEHITEAIEEAIAIGERNGMPVQISHVKLAEDTVWNELGRIIQPVEAARKRGVEVTLDQYPYTATSSGFTSSFPNWCFEGGREKFLERLKDEETYKMIKKYIIERRLTSSRGINPLEGISIAQSKSFPTYEGKNLQEILVLQGKIPTVENAADLIIDIEKNGGASGVFFQMDEKDVENLMRLPYLMHGSDGGIQVVGKGIPHPRSYGTFPRVIGLYVREKGIISLEEAVRKMTSFPAQTLRLKERGMIKEGWYADVTVFDFHTFRDRATFSNPHQHSQGLISVIVNGEVVFEGGQHTGKLPGMILYGKGKK
jgi:N-acyl-D-amino-acid deacylase